MGPHMIVGKALAVKGAYLLRRAAFSPTEMREESHRLMLLPRAPMSSVERGGLRVNNLTAAHGTLSISAQQRGSMLQLPWVRVWPIALACTFHGRLALGLQASRFRALLAGEKMARANTALIASNSRGFERRLNDVVGPRGIGRRGIAPRNRPQRNRSPGNRSTQKSVPIWKSGGRPLVACDRGVGEAGSLSA